MRKQFDRDSAQPLCHWRQPADRDHKGPSCRTNARTASRFSAELPLTTAGKSMRREPQRIDAERKGAKR
jgi:hypothetical protein